MLRHIVMQMINICCGGKMLMANKEQYRRVELRSQIDVHGNVEERLDSTPTR